MEGLRQDLAHAWRATVRSPAHAAAVVATLALGIGPPVAIFSVVDGVLLQPPPYRGADELVVVNGPAGEDGGPAWWEGPPVFTEHARWTLGTATVLPHGAPERVAYLAVEPSFFRVLGVEADRGRLFDPEEDRADAAPVAVVSDRFRRRTWGEEASPAGRTVAIDERAYQVVGSLPAGFTFFRYEDVDLWIPLARAESVRAPSGLARLAPGVDAPAATAALERFLAGGAGPGAQDAPRVRVHGVREALVGELRGPLLVFLAAAALVLTIAIANAANLLLARGVARRGELSVRRALGASRGRMLRQLALEAALLSGAAAVVGVGLAVLGTTLMLPLATHVVPAVLDVDVGRRGMALAIGAAAAAAVGAGLAPALLSLRGAGGPTGGRTRTGSRGARVVESGLVLAETALTVVLLAGSGMLLRTFVELRPSDPGFAVRDRSVVTFALPAYRYDDGGSVNAFVEQVLPRLAAIDGVGRAEAVSNLPLTGLSNYVPATSDGLASRPTGRPTFVHMRSVTDGYLALMDLSLVRGRRATNPDEVAVNEAAVRRFWPEGGSPLGRRLTTTLRDGPRDRTVVGVVRDARIFGGSTEARPEAFVTFDSEPLPSFHVVLEATAPVTWSAVRAAVDEVDPGVPLLEVASLASVIAPSNRVPRFQLALVGSMGTLALLLASLGIFAVLSYATARRTREIGIRVALGARRSRVVGRIVGRGLAPAGAGLILGLAGALLLQGVLEKVFLPVHGLDAPVLLAAAALLALVAGGAALRPALRAASVDPMKVLARD